MKVYKQVYSTRVVYSNRFGDYHRIDGPAVEYSYGSKEWWINGNLHRENGPAIERHDGNKVWCINSKRHREDGPARIWPNGTVEYWINGKELSEEEFNQYLLQMNLSKI